MGGKKHLCRYLGWTSGFVLFGLRTKTFAKLIDDLGACMRVSEREGSIHFGRLWQNGTKPTIRRRTREQKKRVKTNPSASQRLECAKKTTSAGSGAGGTGTGLCLSAWARLLGGLHWSLQGWGHGQWRGGVAGRRGYDETTETLATPRGGRCKLRRGLRLRR